MANPLDITPHASAARIASGNADPIDIGALRTAARLELSLTVATAGANTLSVALQTSDSSSGPWRTIGDFGTLDPTAPVKLEKSFADLDRYVRVAWTITGSTPSFTFQVTGAAHVLYAEPKHVIRPGSNSAALAGIEPSELADWCIVVSTECDGYLAGGKKLPLTAWADDLQQHAKNIVIYRYLNDRGRIPTGPNDIIDSDFNNAIKWLKGVAAGSIDPPGLVDSTPEISEEAYAVVSDPPRGWI